MLDQKTNKQYLEWIVNVFNQIDRILKHDGVVLWNVSYGNENADVMFTTISSIIENTQFCCADVISWHKSSALPNNTSSNKLTRICEFVFVFARKSEYKTFKTNKQVKSISRTGQKYYENMFNFIKAKNNDGTCPFNKATYSSELCEKLLSMYAPENANVYDPFIGTGTTAVACERMGLNCIGSEISANQVLFSLNRMKDEFDDLFKAESNWLYSEINGKTVCGDKQNNKLLRKHED